MRLRDVTLMFCCFGYCLRCVGWGVFEWAEVSVFCLGRWVELSVSLSLSRDGWRKEGGGQLGLLGFDVRYSSQTQAPPMPPWMKNRGGGGGVSGCCCGCGCG